QFMLEGSDGYLALFFFSFAQAILVIFVAGDFRKAEEKARLDQVMLSRPMTTANWVLGKYFGVVSALFYLNIFLLLLATIGRTVKVIATGVGFNVAPFLLYFLIATLPAILFITAFVFFLASLVRAQSVAIILSLAYVASIWAYFHHKFYGLFDYGCFFAPLFYSDLIGFGDISQILQQRLFYTLLAFSFLGFSIILYPRLRQSTFSHTVAAISAVAFLAGAAFVCFNMIAANRQNQGSIEQARAFQEQWISQPSCQIKHYDFDIDFGDNKTPLKVSAKLRLFNPHEQPLRQLAFALNGDLKVSQVKRMDGSTIDFNQEFQLVILDMQDRPLQPAVVETIQFDYAGSIDDDGFLLDRLAGMDGMLYRDDGPWVLGKMAAYLSESHAMLPAEIGWYPFPGTAGGYDLANPRRKNFATATFAISAQKDLSVITQGRRLETKEATARKISRFAVDVPLPKFSLNIGRYERLARKFRVADTLTNGVAANSNSIEIELYYRKYHIRDVEVFEEVADTCFQVVDRILEIMEEQTGLPYPYPKLTYVEVPLQFQAYPTTFGFPTAPSQPQVIMIDELRMAGRHFERAIKRQTRRTRRRRQDDSPEKIKREVFIQSAMSLISEREFDHSVFSPIPNYLNFAVDIADPLLDRAVELQLYESVERRLREVFFPDRWQIQKSRLDEVRGGERWWSSWRFNKFYQTEFDTIITRLETTALSELQPEKEKGLFFGAVDYKASPVLQILAESLGRENYQKGLQALLEKHRYQRITRDDFLAAMQAQTEEDLSGFFSQWFDAATFPGYRVTRAEAEKLDTGKMKIAYQVKARVQNGESGDGFVQVVFHTKGDRITRNIRIDGYEEKEIQIGLEQPPKEVQVIPYFSRNRGKVAKAVDIPNRIRRGAPIDTVFAVTSTVDSLIFFSDDRDEGFFTAAAEESKYLRPKMKGRSWWEYNNPLGYGKYFFGWRYKRAGDGDYPARWESRVPRSGYYDLSFNLPVRSRWWAQNLTRRFKLFITSAEGKQPLEMRFQETADGWVYMGRYRFEKEKPAVIELSDEGQGYILADAIRWEYVQ
ncbi:MAG: M1 family aminopeptidase, partial [bacterium]